jgi:uncharacterized protein (TIGR02145 family)
MKKIISILILIFFAACVSNAQEIIRSLKTGEWEITLEKDVTYTIEPNENSMIVKEGENSLHTFELPNSLLFSNYESEYVTISGVKWATRNLAAHGQFVENPKDIGVHFQWGRKGDGHECTNTWYIGPVSGSENFDVNGQIVDTHDAYGKFVVAFGAPEDWRYPRKDDLWNSGSEAVPIKTTNDPCPDGWRLPTHTELNKLGNGEWTTTPVAGYRFVDGNNTLFLPAAGARYVYDAEIFGVGTNGYYWSSTTCSDPSGFSYHLRFREQDSETIYNNRGSGLSVRCVVE